MTICKGCGRTYEYTRDKGHTTTVCNSCMANRKRFMRKERCLEYKGGACEICGYNKSKQALAFHHKDPAQKDFGISGNHGRSWEVVKEELDKCLLLCHNCHAEIHDNTSI